MAQDTQSRKRKEIAIVGGGISGIAYMWGLRDTNYEVHLFESKSRLGEYANINVLGRNGICVPVDTGFITMNESAYRKYSYTTHACIAKDPPAQLMKTQFTTFLKCLKVRTIPTNMSLVGSAKNGRLEWSSISFGGFFGSLSNILSLRWLGLVFDIIRFNILAVDVLTEYPTPSYQPISTEAEFHDTEKVSKNAPSATFGSIGSYLKRHRYSSQFVNYYIIPMVAAAWCVYPDEFSENFPVATLIDFMLQCKLQGTM